MENYGINEYTISPSSARRKNPVYSTELIHYLGFQGDASIPDVDQGLERHMRMCRETSP